MKDLISIIVPVYNAEKFLKSCIESILNQTYTYFELILVNDGSKDKSGSICDEYAKKDKRIKVIHSENQGVSITRNKGLQMAQGEYIQFVDSDDYIDCDMCKIMYSQIKSYSTDLVICGLYSIEYKNTIKLKGTLSVIENTSDLIGAFCTLYEKGFINSACNKIYKKELIVKLFNENISFGEDLIFNLEYLKNTDKFVVVEDILYFYNRIDNGDSLSKINAIHKLDFLLFSHKEINDFCDFYKIDKRTGVYNYFIKDIADVMQSYITHSNDPINEKVDTIKDILRLNAVKTAKAYSKFNNIEKKIILFCMRINNPYFIIAFFYFKEILKRFLVLVKIK